ncbi:MAG: pentapeptide repeat-containing protein [Alistipes sp.]|jgi:uncharacterized protein YjbI with pentapeptide repeats|nr:pentapeptide repeat-containing protein [Alistipes sp.]
MLTHRNETFRRQDYARQSLAGCEFEGCAFVGCDFSYADLGGCIFSDCLFDDCRLALTVVADAVLRRVTFKKSDLRGIDFGSVSEFGLEIACEHSRLDNCSFVRRKMRSTPFRGGELRECYFAECDLSGAVFDECVMEGTLFERCDLSGADLRTAVGYAVDPVGNRLAKARFSEYNLAGLVASLGVVVE